MKKVIRTIQREIKNIDKLFLEFMVKTTIGMFPETKIDTAEQQQGVLTIEIPPEHNPVGPAGAELNIFVSEGSLYVTSCFHVSVDSDFDDNSDNLTAFYALANSINSDAHIRGKVFFEEDHIICTATHHIPVAINQEAPFRLDETHRKIWSALLGHALGTAVCDFTIIDAILQSISEGQSSPTPCQPFQVFCHPPETTH